MWVRTRGGVALLRFCASVSVALPRWCEGSLTLPRLTRVASAVAWHCRGRRAKHGSVVPPRITQQQSLSAAVYACCRASLPWYNCGRAALPYLARRPRRGASAFLKNNSYCTAMLVRQLQTQSLSTVLHNGNAIAAALDAIAVNRVAAEHVHRRFQVRQKHAAALPLNCDRGSTAVEHCAG